MQLSNFENRSPEELWRDSLSELGKKTRIYYERYFSEFLAYFETDIQGFHDFVYRTQNSDKSSERLAVNSAFSSFADHLIEKGVHKNTVPQYRKSVNYFLKTNALDLITKKVKTVEPIGSNILTKDQIRETLAYQKVDLRNVALGLVAKDTGLRISDITQLTVDDFVSARIIYDKVGREFRVWKTPLTSEKTGVKAFVTMGPESVYAVKVYLSGRTTGAMFLTKETQQGTPKGSPMSKDAISSVFKDTICKPLKAQGIKCSAHSFRKFFINSLQHILETAKYVSGKAIKQTDEAYLSYNPLLYIDNYSHIELDVNQEEINHLQQENKKLNNELESLRRMVTELSESIVQIRREQWTAQDRENSAMTDQQVAKQLGVPSLVKAPNTNAEFQTMEEALAESKKGIKPQLELAKKTKSKLDEIIAKVQEEDQ